MTTEQKLREALRFTKKPVTIEAIQFTKSLRDAILFDGEPCPDGVKRGATTLHPPTRKVWRAEFFILTLEGAMNVSVGDWIIKGVKGEYYPCKPDIFAATYEPEALALPTTEPRCVGEVVAYRETITGRLCDPDDTHRQKFPMCYRPLTYAGTDSATDDMFTAEDVDAYCARARSETALECGQALQACIDAITAFQDPAENYPEDTPEFRDLDAALKLSQQQISWITAPPAADLTDEQIVAGARELCKIHADQYGVDADDTWAIYSDQFKADAKACLEAAITAKVKGG